jgi:acetyl esterase/lipase
MSGLLSTVYKFIRLRGSASLFDRGYLVQFELSERGRPALLSTDGLRIERDICYQPSPVAERSQQSLDVYVSLKASESLTNRAGLPVVVFMHGGGWRAADKQDALGIHANICTALAHRGLLAVNVNYRLSPRVKHPAHALDVAHALAWVRENIKLYGGDAENIFVSGHSSGGHLAALVTLDERYLREAGATSAFIKGVVGISGIYNIGHFAGRNRLALRSMTRPAFGLDTKVWDDASPINHARVGAPPFLMINAEDDEKLEEEAEELAALLKKAGATADTHIIPGTNHFTILGFVGNGNDSLIEQIVSFVEKNSITVSSQPSATSYQQTSKTVKLTG